MSRHRVSGRKLSRNTPHRKAMWRNMAISLLTHKQITTTLPKAKSLQPMVEKLITLAKKGDLASRRRVMQQIGNPIMVDRDLTDFDRNELRREGYKVNKYHELKDGPRLVKHLFDDIAPQYMDREGGCTRIVRLGTHRIGDAGDLCVIQLLGEEDKDAPQVAGEYSRRRQKADRRMEFAARLRRKARGGGETSAEPESEAGGGTAVAEAEPEATTEAETSPEPQGEDTGKADEGETPKGS